MPHLASLPVEAGPPAIYTRYPDIYGPWSRMSEVLMNGPSPLNQGQRELILAYAAGVAGCEFVCRAHAEVAYAWGIERGVVARLLEDPGSAPLDDRLKVLLALVRKLAVEPTGIGQGDIDAVLAAGWSEDALHGAVAVAARAAFMHRLVAAYGFTPLSQEIAAKHAKRRLEHGYVNLYPSLAEPKA
jgi:alkylhydroperoxidase family enzyme